MKKGDIIKSSIRGRTGPYDEEETYMAVTNNSRRTGGHTVDFDSAFNNIVKANLTPEQYANWDLSTSIKKELGHLLSIYSVFSEISYPAPFKYTEITGKDPKGNAITRPRAMDKEIRSLFQYVISLYSIYDDVKREALRNDENRISIDRMVAQHQTRNKAELSNGRTGDDEEGRKSDLLGYVEGDNAGATPELSLLMDSRLSRLVEILSGQSIQAVRDGTFSIDDAVAYALSEDRTYTEAELGAINDTLVQLRESLPNMGREFSGRQISEDTHFATSCSRLSAVIAGTLRDNPAFTARSIVNNLFGPDSMAVLEGENEYDAKDGSNKGMAALTKINGTISDKSEVPRLIEAVRKAIESHPTVFQNQYSPLNTDSIPGFFLNGQSYNIGGQNNSELNRRKSTLRLLERQYVENQVRAGRMKQGYPYNPKDEAKLSDEIERLKTALEESTKRESELIDVDSNAQKEYVAAYEETMQQRIKINEYSRRASMGDKRKDDQGNILEDMKTELSEKEKHLSELMPAAGKAFASAHEKVEKAKAELRMKELLLSGWKEAEKEQMLVFRLAMNSLQKSIYDTSSKENEVAGLSSLMSDFLSSVSPFMQDTKDGPVVNSRLRSFMEETENAIRQGLERVTAQMGMERHVEYKGEVPTGLETESYKARMEGAAYRSELINNRRYISDFRRYYELYTESKDCQNKQIDSKNLLISPHVDLFADESDRLEVLDLILDEDAKKMFDKLAGGMGAAAKAELTEALFNPDIDYCSKDTSFSMEDRRSFNSLASYVRKAVAGFSVVFDDDKARTFSLDFSDVEESKLKYNPLTDALMLYLESERRQAVYESMSAKGTVTGKDIADLDEISLKKAEAAKNVEECRNRLFSLIGAGKKVKLVFTPTINTDTVRFIQKDGTTMTYGIKPIEGEQFEVVRTVDLGDGRTSVFPAVTMARWDLIDDVSKAKGTVEIMENGKWKRIGSYDSDAIRDNAVAGYAQSFVIRDSGAVKDEKLHGFLEHVAEKAVGKAVNRYSVALVNLVNEAGRLEGISDEIVKVSTDLRRQNAAYLVESYTKVADEKGLKIDRKGLEELISDVVDTIWNERKKASADVRTVETFNQYRVRGIFDDALDKLEDHDADSLPLFRNGAATLVTMKDCSGFLSRYLPQKEMEGLHELYNRYQRADALTADEEKTFHDAHDKLLSDKEQELRMERRKVEKQFKNDLRILQSPFNAGLQYDLGMELKKKLKETGDLDSLSSVSDRLVERARMKQELVKSFAVMRDTLKSMMLQSPVKDIDSNENADINEKDFNNIMFPVKEAALFLINHDLEREEEGSYTYPQHDVEMRFFNRLIENALNELKEKLGTWRPGDDESAHLLDADSYVPECVIDYLEKRKAYDRVLGEIGIDARYEQMKNMTAEFSRNNPLDPFGTMMRRYFESVEHDVDEMHRKTILSEAVRLSDEAPYMGREAKLLHRSNPNASRDALVATAQDFMSEKEQLVHRLSEEKERLESLSLQIKMLSSFKNEIFAVVGTTVPDYGQAVELVKDDRGTLESMQTVLEDMRKAYENGEKALERNTGRYWKDSRLDLQAYMSSFYSRIEGLKLDEQMDMLRSSILAAPMKADAKLLFSSYDPNGYWRAETNIDDPVFKDSFSVVSDYLIKLNEGIERNGHELTNEFKAVSLMAGKTPANSIEGIRNRILASYADAVMKNGRDLSKKQMNVLFEQSHAEFIASVNDFARDNHCFAPRISMYFKQDADGRTMFKDKTAFRDMISNDERFREKRGNARVASITGFLQYMDVPLTTVSRFDTALFIKDLGNKVERPETDWNEMPGAGAYVIPRGSDFYRINARNIRTPGMSQDYCAVLFRTYGKNSINKESVLAMIAMKTGMMEESEALRKGYSQKDLKYIRADLDPEKWDVITPSNFSGEGRTGLVMMVPKTRLSGVKTVKFLMDNPLFVTEGRIDLSSGLTLSGIDRMRRFLADETARLQKETEFADDFRKASIAKTIESYSKQLDALADLENVEKTSLENGRSLLEDREGLYSYLSKSDEDLNVEFFGIYDRASVDKGVEKAVKDMNEKYDTEKGVLSSEMKGVPYFNPYSNGLAADERKKRGPKTAAAVDIERRPFFNAEDLNNAKMNGSWKLSNPMRFSADRFIENIKERGGLYKSKVKGVKSVFDQAFKPIDGKGTPLYQDPIRFGFLLSFIHDNYRLDRRQSFCMAGGPLLNEEFVANADDADLYKTIADGYGDNEISYLVYKKMFDAANMDVLLNPKEISNIREDDEDMGTDEAIELSIQEEEGSRSDDGVPVMPSVSMEHFAAVLPEIDEYGMNQQHDSFVRYTAYENKEMKRSIPDDDPNSIYGRLDMKGIGRFEEMFSLMERHVSGYSSKEDDEKLSDMIPESVNLLGRGDIDITTDDVREWFRTWMKGDDMLLSQTYPSTIPVERKMKVLESLLPLCGMEQAKEGTTCRKNMLDDVVDLLDSIAGVDPEDVSFHNLKNFYDAVRNVSLDRNGLPDFSSLDIDFDSLDEETRKVLASVLEDGRNAGRLYAILSTAGMSENVIPENMEDAITIVEMSEAVKPSVEQYSKLFSETFSEQMEEYKERSTFVDFFSDPDNAETLYDGLKTLTSGNAEIPDEVLAERMRKIIADLSNQPTEKVFASLRLAVTPGKSDDAQALAMKVSSELAAALKSRHAGLTREDFMPSVRPITESFSREVDRLSHIIDEFISRKLSEARLNNLPLKISPSALRDYISLKMTGSLIPNDIILSKGFIEGIVREIAEAKNSGTYMPVLPSHEIDEVRSIVATHLVTEGDFLSRLVKANMHDFEDILSSKEPSILEKVASSIKGEQWRNIERAVSAAEPENRAAALADAFEEFNVSPLSRLRETFGLKEDLEDAVERIASQKKKRSFFISPSLVSNESGRISDVIRNARSLERGEGRSVEELLVPYAIVPVSGYYGRNEDGTYSWKTRPSGIPVYSKERFEEVLKLLRNFPNDEALKAVASSMEASRDRLIRELRQANTPNDVRRLLGDILGREGMARRELTVRFFKGLTSDDIKLLPDDIADIERTFDGSRINPAYIAKLRSRDEIGQSKAEQEKRMEKEPEKSSPAIQPTVVSEEESVPLTEAQKQEKRERQRLQKQEKKKEIGLS